MRLVLASIFYFQLTFAFAQKHHIIPASTRITKLPFTMLTVGTIIIKAQLDNFEDTLNVGFIEYSKIQACFCIALHSGLKFFLLLLLLYQI
jgi:hypothetical protein